MSLIKLKNLSRLKLTDLLRRRKMTLRDFLDEFGITTYMGLCIKCDRIGVSTPDEEAFDKVNIKFVSNPQEGVVVVEPIDVILSERTGEVINDNTDAFLMKGYSKKKKKKEDPQDVS